VSIATHIIADTASAYLVPGRLFAPAEIRGFILYRETTDLRLSPVRYRSESLKPPFYYAGRVAFFPASGWFGLEGELVHLKVVADTARQVRFEGVVRAEATDAVRLLSSLVQRFSITHGVNLLLVNAVARRTAQVSGNLPPRWILTGRVGAGTSLPHPESTVDGLSLERYEWGSFSAQAAAGMELRLTTRLYLSGEYKLTRTAQDVSVAAGSARTPLVTHHAVAGGHPRRYTPRQKCRRRPGSVATSRMDRRPAIFREPENRR
jgi:hypothetical protein